MRARNILIASTWLALGAIVAGPPAWGQSSTSSFQAADEIRLEPGDVLGIRVWPDEDLSGEFAVEETGYVYLPMLGRVRATGLSLAALREQLRDGYAEVMKNPVVTVTPRFSVGVLGAVSAPGVYQATPSSSLIDMIGMAGGFANRANQRKVRLVREGNAVEFNAWRALEEGVALHDLRLRSGDQIVVPRRSGGVSFNAVVGFIQTGATIGFLIDRVISN